MIITITAPGQPETAEEYTLLAPFQPSVNKECPLCSNRQSVWFAAPASTASMDPGSTVLKAGQCCAQCMNDAILQDIVVVTEVDPDSF